VARRVQRVRGEGGQVVPLLAVVVLVVVVGLLVVAGVGGAAVDRARARTAADAAATAGVLVDRDEAEAVARANGGELESFVAAGGQVEVVVRVGDARAAARAELTWAASPAPAAPVAAGSQGPEGIG
jgi:hypothetical protein